VAVVDEPGAGAPEVETFTATSEADRKAQVDALAQQGTVVAVEPDEPVYALVAPNDDPNFTHPGSYGLTNSGFTTAWTNGYDGSGVTIAIVDTGVLATHEDLAERVDTVNGRDFVIEPPGGNGTNDQHGHGTHVAGIAAATDNTVGGLGGAPGATILPVRVLNANGSGFTSDVVAGIYWAADHGADVISMSLGGSHCSASEQAAVSYAESLGAVVVAAAGNSNSNVPIYPAGFEGEVIAVGSTTSANTKSGFSNWGTPFVDIAAPGSSILSTYKPGPSTYASLSGTSMATPYVAAAVALVLERCPAITNGSVNGASVADKVLTMLQSTASPSIAGMGASLVQAGTATAAACPS
jgi:subtilisin family serine protease